MVSRESEERGVQLGVRVQDGRELSEEAGPADLADHLLRKAAELAVGLGALGRDRPKTREELVRARQVPFLERQLDEFLERGSGLEEAGRLLLGAQDGRHDLEHRLHDRRARGGPRVADRSRLPTGVRLEHYLRGGRLAAGGCPLCPLFHGHA